MVFGDNFHMSRSLVQGAPTSSEPSIYPVICYSTDVTDNYLRYKCIRSYTETGFEVLQTNCSISNALYSA